MSFLHSPLPNASIDSKHVTRPHGSSERHCRAIAGKVEGKHYLLLINYKLELQIANRNLIFKKQSHSGATRLPSVSRLGSKSMCQWYWILPFLIGNCLSQKFHRAASIELVFRRRQGVQCTAWSAALEAKWKTRKRITKRVPLSLWIPKFGSA